MALHVLGSNFGSCPILSNLQLAEEYITAGIIVDDWDKLPFHHALMVHRQLLLLDLSYFAIENNKSLMNVDENIFAKKMTDWIYDDNHDFIYNIPLKFFEFIDFHVENIYSLDLSRTYYFSDVAPFIKRMKNLSSLTLNKMELNDDEIIDLLFSNELDYESFPYNLNELTISRNNLTDRTLQAIIDNVDKIEQLIILDISMCFNFSEKMLINMIKKTAIYRISLVYIDITTDFLEFLSTFESVDDRYIQLFPISLIEETKKLIDILKENQSNIFVYISDI